MAFPDSVLSELGRQLRDCADRALLDSPLDGLGVQVTDIEAREVLQGIYEAGDADTLRELLAAERLQRWCDEIATPREQQVVSAQLRAWLGIGHRGEDDPARLARVPALPDEPDAIVAWARTFALLGDLNRPACELLNEHAALAAETSLLACCIGRFDAVSRGASLFSAHRARTQARGYLQQRAAAHAALAAREELWKRAPPEGPLRMLAERLRAVLAGTDPAGLHSVVFVPACRVSVDLDHGTARGRLRSETEPGPSSIAATLFMSEYEQRAIHGECSECTGPRCLHVRALAARVLDACIDANDRLHPLLQDFVDLPAWRRFLRTIAGDDPARTKARASSRLSFRVRVDGDRVRVGAMLHTALPDGRAPGRLVSLRSLARSPARSDRDRPVLDALAGAGRTLGAQLLPADLTVLRSLVEHPFVQLEDSSDALRVSEESIHVALLEQGDDLRLEVSLAGAKLAAGERHRDTGYAMHLDRANGTLVFAALTPALHRLLAGLARFRGVLPPESYPLLSRWIASIQHVARVSAPRILLGTERDAARKLVLRITPGREENIDVALTVRALASGPLWPPGQGPELASGMEDAAQVSVRRDLDWERETAAHVLQSLGVDSHVRMEPFAYRIEGTQASLAILSDAARLGNVLEIEWAENSPKLSLTGAVHGRDLAITLFRKGQWFEVHGGARNATAEIAIGRLLEAARRGERFVLVQGSDYIEIERELFARMELAQVCVTDAGRAPAMSTAAAPFWLEKLGAWTAPEDPATRAWLERMRDGEVDPISIAPAWRTCLRDYQVHGVEWLLERSRWAPGVCLADEMGLGKTVQAIALLDARARLGAALVIAPTSVVGNWLDELARFAPGLSVSAYQGTSRDRQPLALRPGSVLVTSYDVLLRDREHFADLAFATQIVDEAQMIKNAHTQRARAVTSIDAAFRVALSGTPVENRLGDLWSLFQLIAPGLLGSWTKFKSTFAVPIERYENPERAAALRLLVSPFVLRRTKNEVARELPSRTEVVHRIDLSAAEQDLYDAAVDQARRAVGRRRREDGGRSTQILAEITRLRQLACHPRLVIDESRIESSKLNALLQLLEDILPRGHRVLLFSQFTRHLALVREALARTGASYLYLDGATPAAQRTRLVERFQEGEGQVFLISLKAGGTGLNLTAADYVVHMDPWWNPAAEDQASDRAHRLGQQRPLTIVKLVAQGTIEERVLGLHGHKRRLADAVLEGTATPTSLDIAALESLLAL